MSKCGAIFFKQSTKLDNCFGLNQMIGDKLNERKILTTFPGKFKKVHCLDLSTSTAQPNTVLKLFRNNKYALSDRISLSGTQNSRLMAGMMITKGCGNSLKKTVCQALFLNRNQLISNSFGSCNNQELMKHSQLTQPFNRQPHP